MIAPFVLNNPYNGYEQAVPNIVMIFVSPDTIFQTREPFPAGENE